ncbi:MAG TPA: hypothetical protein VGY76_02550 [Solirubrobacteraceae bacterium]|jgi:dephospho-CoA kinase|nr:hypothetical protein [Solirubrobacteraceae bacterium]
MSLPRRYDRQFRPRFSRLHLDRDLRWVVPLSVRYVVAITGERFAGKSVALAYLTEKHGFEVYSLATTLRELAVEFGVPLEPRHRLQDLGDELRTEHRDPAYLARLTLRKIHRDHLDHRARAEAPRRIAVGSFKRLEEVRLFEALDRFRQLNIFASRKVRLERALDSGIMAQELMHLSPPPALDMATFKRHIERRDRMGNDNPWTDGYGQAVAEVTSAKSAKTISNRGRLADLATALDGEISDLDEQHSAFSG